MIFLPSDRVCLFLALLDHFPGIAQSASAHHMQPKAMNGRKQTNHDSRKRNEGRCRRCIDGGPPLSIG